MWQNKKICNLGRVVTGKTPPTSNSEYFDGEELFVSPKDLDWNQYYVKETETRITEKALEKFKNQVLPKNTVLFTSLSFAFGKMGIASRSLLTNQQINSIIVNQENYYRFVYYLLRAYTPIIFSYNSGIDTPIVPKSVFENIKVRCPEKNAQKKIAAILSAYDDLIENNKRRITLLGKMAEEIYREWFVRLRFPGHENVKIKKGVPQGWKVEKLPNIAEITYGFPFQSSRFNTKGLGKPIIRIRNIPDSSTQDYTDEVVADKYIVNKGDLIVGMDGEFHINHWYGDEAYLVQRVCRLKAKNPLLSGYLAKAVYAPIKYYESILMGATLGHLGAKHLNNIDILVPPPEFDSYINLFNALQAQKLNLASSTNKLRHTRDILLARLISGKLAVENLNIQFPPSMLDEAEGEAIAVSAKEDTDAKPHHRRRHRAGNTKEAKA
jgi:type I restriction enzyme S subunit